jgi:hypothetical protein
MAPGSCPTPFSRTDSARRLQSDQSEPGRCGSGEVFSDEPERPHQVLWDKQGYVGGIGGRIPVVQERAALVVVEGGVGGLVTGYLLRAC